MKDINEVFRKIKEELEKGIRPKKGDKSFSEFIKSRKHKNPFF
jgi:hypothetical protein